MKKVAILLTTYNGEKYLGEMLDSLLAQTTQDFVCYFHDDGSSDETAAIARDYARRYPGKFAPVAGYEKHFGARDHFFYMLRNVEADHYFFADQDDVWLPDKLEKTLACMSGLERESNIPLAVFSDMTVVDEGKNEIAPSFLSYMGRNADYHSYTEILIDNPASGATMCINRACRDKGLEIAHQNNVQMHDVWFLLVAAVFGKVDTIRESLCLYRQHGDNEMGAVTEGTLQKVVRNIGLFFSGEFRKEKRAFYEEKQRLASELLLLSDIPDDKRMVLEQFVDIHHLSLFRKIAFLRKNGFHRAQNSLWIWIWI